MKLDNLYGYKKLIPTMKADGNYIILGGICKEFDRDGQLLNVTACDNVRINCYDQKTVQDLLNNNGR